MMELSRRNLLRYGAATGAGLMLPRFAKGKDHGRGVVMPMLSDPSCVHTYEDGVDATAVGPGDGVLETFGQPTYSSADAVHGMMGWLSAAGAGGGRLAYANPSPPASSGSVYLMPRAVPSGSTATVVSFWADVDASAPGARIRLTSEGRVDLVNASGARQAISSAVWTQDQPLRLDWRQLWDGTTLAVTVWLYGGANSEGWRPDDSLQASFATTSPTFVSLGQDSNGSVSVGFDTYREYDAATVPAPYSPLIGGFVSATFEDGVDNQPVVAGVGGITGVSGHPKYSTSAAMHGNLGVLLPPTGAGILRYANPYPPAQTGSLYVHVAARGGADSRIVTFQNGQTVLAQIKLAKNGTIYVADPAGRMLAQTASKAKVGRWARIDWQQTWDGTTLTLDARYFATDPESIDNFTEAQAAILASATPDTVAIGSSSSTWKIAMDTLRMYGDVSAWPEPFAPALLPRAPGLALWAGDATQTTVEIAAYTNDTTAVGLLVSANADMSDATSWPAAPPNANGWNKWSVTGLSPGTRYYHQLTDTPDGGQTAPISDISTFATLRPVGVECTIRIAVGSCADNSPTDNSCFDDIVAWGPDRTMHLGDFGYPNNLSRDLSTHMANWSLNATDAGFSKIMSIGCMDYIISDHDDNGTGNSNMPNFDDPVTMASISAWQQVVPARMEDTQQPPHGRWRSDVEGNVRFVKLDTRCIDKSDTTAAPTDPSSPDSTMLGATQLEWLKGQIDAAASNHQLIVIFSDCAWNGVSPGPPIPASFCDKWPSYIYERDLISDYAAAAGAQLFIAFGDSHGLQQDDGANEKNGFASICCGPFDNDLHMHYQDSYQWSYPDGILDEGGPYRQAQQYQRLTISQDPGSPDITVTADARDCSPVVDGTPLTVRTLTKVYTP
jgi:hypothetical protein